MTNQPPSQNNPLRNLAAANGRNHFTNTPLEYVVPKTAKVIFVSDLFVEDYIGGAELTSEALMAKSPHRVFKLHSQSLTIDMLQKNLDKYWILCNFTQVDSRVLEYLVARDDVRYSVVEYDYKYCVFRSEVLHQKQTNGPCDCPLRPHAMLVEKLYSKAQHVFWMSERQKETFLNKLPSLCFLKDDHHIVQSSTFEDSHLDFLLSVKNSTEKKFPIKVWAIQGSQNWIKGTQDTVAWAAQQKLATRVLGNMAYEDFIRAMSSCHGLIFRPLDLDTCPRVVIEAKILGLELLLNDNVQHKDEAWFKDKSPEDIVAYLRNRGDFFWKHIEV